MPIAKTPDRGECARDGCSNPATQWARTRGEAQPVWVCSARCYDLIGEVR